MEIDLASLLIGTAGLSIVLLISIALSASRRAVTPRSMQAIRIRSAAMIVVQSVHFAEEWVTGFSTRYPELLGLAPWPESLFVAFNLVWIAIWVVSVVAIGSSGRFGTFPLWFLAIASVANAVVHPVLALVSRGYFPGLWSSPLAGILGIVLWRALIAATANDRGASR